MKLIVDPVVVYQLAITYFNVQLAKILNYATYAVSYRILHADVYWHILYPDIQRTMYSSKMLQSILT